LVPKRGEEAIKMIGYKGFNKDLKCNRFEFEVGKTYVHDGEVALCKSGFHFCEHPFDVLAYYPPAGNRFCLIHAEDVSNEKHNDDTKRVCKKIEIVKELDLALMTMAAVELAQKNGNLKQSASGDNGAATASGYRGAASASGDNGAASASGDSGAASASGYRGAATASGNSGAATASGDSGAATASGYSGAATASGYRGAATASGEHSVASATGRYGHARGRTGSALFAVERDSNWEIISIASAIVDGEKIKEMTWYRCKDGQLVEAGE
jgi:hypothetical protein